MYFGTHQQEAISIRMDVKQIRTGHDKNLLSSCHFSTFVALRSRDSPIRTVSSGKTHESWRHHFVWRCSARADDNHSWWGFRGTTRVSAINCLRTRSGRRLTDCWIPTINCSIEAAAQKACEWWSSPSCVTNRAFEASAGNRTGAEAGAWCDCERGRELWRLRVSGRHLGVKTRFYFHSDRATRVTSVDGMFWETRVECDFCADSTLAVFADVGNCNLSVTSVGFQRATTTVGGADAQKPSYLMTSRGCRLSRVFAVAITHVAWRHQLLSAGFRWDQAAGGFRRCWEDRPEVVWVGCDWGACAAACACCRRSRAEVVSRWSNIDWSLQLPSRVLSLKEEIFYILWMNVNFCRSYWTRLHAHTPLSVNFIP